MRTITHMILSLFIGFFLGAAALLFALQNTEIVALTFMGWQFETTLAVLVLASVGVGILISILASLPAFVSNSLRIMGLKKENRKLAQEIHTQRETIQTIATEPPVVVDVRPR